MYAVFIIDSTPPNCVYSFLFWSDWGSYPNIERARLDGTERQIIVFSNIIWPNGLALDMDGRRVYWAEGHEFFTNIYSVNYNGGNRRVAVMLDVYTNFPFGLSFYNGFVFWTDWRTTDLFRARVTPTSGSTNKALIQKFRGSELFQLVVVSMSNPRVGGTYRQTNI